MNSGAQLSNWAHGQEPAPPASLVLDPKLKCAAILGRRIKLTKLEFSVLCYLSNRAGTVVTYEELLSEVWNTGTKMGGTYAQVKNCIRRLRLKIEPIPSKPIYIITAFGYGYITSARIEQTPAS